MDPRTDKARDDARQRKLMRNGSDKAARRHAKDAKSHGHRAIRREVDRTLRHDPAAVTVAGIAVALRSRPRAWCSYVAAEARAWLDATPVADVRGRGRWCDERGRRRSTKHDTGAKGGGA